MSFLKRHRASASIVALLVALGATFGYRKMAALAADPAGEKTCRPAQDDSSQKPIDLSAVRAIKPLADVKWSQLGGSINDASCLNKTEIYGVVEVHSVDDIAKTLTFARDNKLSVTTRRRPPQHGRAGVPQGRHRARHAHLQQHRAERERRSITVQPGATWHDIQNVAAAALRGASDAIDRHLHGRRLDLGQCPRHGPPGRRARANRSSRCG